MDPKRSLVLIGIGVSIIAVCVIYMAFRDSCRRNYSVSPQYACRTQTTQRNAIDSAQDAEKLVSELVKNAKKITKEQGEGEAYYNALLKAVATRFGDLGKTIDDPVQKIQSDKFLQSLNDKIEPKAAAQTGGGSGVKELDIKRVIDATEDPICRVYPCLQS